jgi:type VII secretion protein EccB
MTTRKDLVEAHTFSRRRLVTAFVSGAPGGLEVEPTRPGRTLAGGVVLTVLLLAGVGVAGFLTGRPDPGWLDEGSFVVSRDTGEQYVVLHGGDEPLVHRVANYVSAQLVLGEAEPDPHLVADSDLRGVTTGPDVGIARAPAVLPGPDGLVGSGWTACTADGAGTRVTVARERRVRGLEDSAVVVRAGPDGPHWLVAPAPGSDGRDDSVRRFRLPADQTGAGTLVDQLGFGALGQAPLVDEAWLRLFPAGPALTEEAFGVRGAGPARYEGVTPDLSRFRVGDLVHTADDRHYLLADDAPQRLDGFAALLRGSVASPPHELDTEISAAFEAPGHPWQWPRSVPSPIRGGDLCAVLVTNGEEAPRVALATEADRATGAEGVPAGHRRVVVDPTAAAFVRSGFDDHGRAGTPYVIASAGERHALVGPSVADHLGYGAVAAPLVPAAWLALFDAGVPLSVEAAVRGPGGTHGSPREARVSDR